jgi:CelD/BcsL family acetyltransferase involved in cellulose biosynthesis
MRVARLTTLEDLNAVASRWNALAEVPFRSHDWLASWWRHYGAGQELYVLAVIDQRDAGALDSRDADAPIAVDGPALIGLAPLYLERSASRGRVLKLLGAGDVCSDYLGLLTAPGRETEATSALAQALIDANSPDAAAAGASWDLLELSGVAADDANVARVVGHLVEDGAQVHRREGPSCWRIELPPRWDDLLESMSKSHRKQIRRVERRLLETGRAVLHTADEDRLERGMEILVDLHQRRRRALGQPGCFASPAFAGFLCDAAPRLLTSGRLELHWIELAGRPVAAEFHLVGEGLVYAYQAGVEPEVLEEEPGRLINVATLRRSVERGRRGFDFLRGDEPYKAHWRAAPRAMLELRVVPSAASARLRHGVWMAGDTVKQLIKTGLNLTGMR